MRARIDPGPDLLRLASVQAGVITAEQAAAFGVGRHSLARLIGTGNWRRLERGIISTGPEPEWMSYAWAGILLGGESARLGGMAAAYLHGLDSDPPDRILVHVDHELRRRDRARWKFRRRVRDKQFSPPRGEPPRICVEDLVLDLIDNDSDDPRQRSAAHWVTTAVQRGRTTPRRLRAALSARAMIHDRDLIEAMLADVDAGAESTLEVRYLNDVERAHGLPCGRRQAVRRAARFEGTIRAFRDVLYEEFGLVVELDGRPGHVEEGRLRDLRRDNVTTLRGERTLRYGWIDVVDEPCLTALQVGGGLRLGGWMGTPNRCWRCRNLPDSDLWELGAG